MVLFGTPHEVTSPIWISGNSLQLPRSEGSLATLRVLGQCSALYTGP
jgi:hypothetical protein